MTVWAKDELQAVAASDDLHVAPFREDGVTYGTPTWIWSVGSTARSMRAPTTAAAPGGFWRRSARRPGGSGPPA